MISVMSEREINQKYADDVPTVDIGHEQGLDLFRQQIEVEDVPSEVTDKDGSGSPDFTTGGELIRMDEVRLTNSTDFGGRFEKSIHGSELLVVPSGDLSATWMHGYQIGDMVWGKVKSHPWWPGHIYNEAFASPSVRRTKREGHLLVAFFGDSSYGWFDPEELIPFEPHYFEKSKQTNARTFLKAVEEATDEASRRGALAVTCKCRNPYNFRTTGIPGYFAVDVFGYEHGGIYSSEQIKKIRDSFDPARMLWFVKELACSPRNDAYRAISDILWIQNISMILAYRRAIFEEYDEPYAEAFGMQPVRPSPNEFGIHGQAERFAPRAAPLSGLQVIPEALGARKAVTTTINTSGNVRPAPSAHKPAKVSASKKNKYEFKRREEPYYPSNVNLFSAQQHGISYSQSAAIPPQQQFQLQNVHHYVPEAVDAKQAQAAEFVLQKRSPVFVRQESFRNEQESRPHLALADVHTVGAGAHAFPETFGEPKPQNDGAFVGAQSKQDLFSQANVQPVADNVSVATETGTMNFTAPVIKAQELKRAVGVKVAKLPKRKREDGITARTDDLGLVKKTKKLKKDSSIAVGPERLLQKKYAGSVPGRPESAQGELHRRGIVGSALLQLPKVDISTMNIDFSQVITDLSELAIDPFYGSELNVPSIVSHIILKFRSLVYQKSLVLPPASETETPEFRAAKLAAGRVLLPEQQSNVNIEMAVVAKDSGEQREPAQQPPSVRRIKPSLRPDDPTKSGRKRVLSSRQEEISVKRVKKLTQVKTLAAEKKAVLVQKPPERNKQDQEAPRMVNPSPVAPPVRAVSRTQHSKKEETPEPTKVVSPTYLVMKFPPNSTLPSIASMKAKFARFGTLEPDSFRVYWKSLTCKVLFRHRVDAVAAYSFGRSNDMFGYKVNYSIRDADAPVTEPPSQDPLRRQEPKADGTQFSAGNGNAATSMSLNPLRSLQQPRLQSGQLKSILKKPNDDVSGSGSGPVKESQRVKFMLGGDDVRKEPPSIVASNNKTGGGGGVRVELPMDPVGVRPSSMSSSMNYIPPSQPLIRPSLPQHPPPRFQQPSRLLEPHHPTPPQFQQPPRSSELQHPPAPQFQQPSRLPDVHYRPLGQQQQRMPQPPADSTRKILYLLHKCSGIMTNLETSLGYVPYHGL